MKHKENLLGKRSSIFLLFLMCVLLSYAQTRKITGQVVDGNGEPVIGANIAVDGVKGIGAISDMDGNFSINVPEGKKLIVSFIGFITEAVTPKSTTVKIALQESSVSLDEVVSIGYANQKLKNVTGSVATISASELEDLPVSNMSEALQGMINGLEVSLGSPRPGTNADEVYVRQSRTFNGISKDGGNAVPLIIIDDVMQLGDNGQPSMEQFNLLDPSEVESLSLIHI